MKADCGEVNVNDVAKEECQGSGEYGLFEAELEECQDRSKNTQNASRASRKISLRMQLEKIKTRNEF